MKQFRWTRKIFARMELYDENKCVSSVCVERAGSLFFALDKSFTFYGDARVCFFTPGGECVFDASLFEVFEYEKPYPDYLTFNIEAFTINNPGAL